MNQALLVVKNLGRKKLRTALMLVAIFIAFFLYGALESFNRAVHSSETAAAANRLTTVNRINFTVPLPVNYVERIKRVQGVRDVTYQSWFGGYYQDPREVLFMFAADPESYLAVYPSLLMPAEQRSAWLANRAGLAVGKSTAVKYHWKAGDRVPISSNIFSNKNGSHTWEFDINAIFTSPEDPSRESMVFMHHDYFDETVTFGRDMVSQISFTTSSAKLNDSIEKQIDAEFANSSAETTTVTAAEFNKAFIAQFGNITLIISLVVASAFVAILLIVGNTMVMAVRERTRDIGVLKTLGFRSSTILAQILAESLLLALLGAAFGLLAAKAAVAALAPSVSGFATGMRLTPPIVAAGLGWAIVLGLVTGAIPAWSGTRLRIATALGRR